MAVTPTDDLLERLKDPEYAKLYGAENAKVDFAITLTKARKNLSLTQKSLANKLGISQPYVAKLESGEANPTLGKVGSLLAAIDLKLVTGTASLEPEPIPSGVGLALTGAIGASDTVLVIARTEEESRWVSAGLHYTVPVNAGTAMDMPSVKPERYTARVAVAGGTV